MVHKGIEMDSIVVESFKRVVTYMGASLNHVDQFLAIFDPPPPPLWTDVDFWMTPPPINYVDFWKTPPFTTFFCPSVSTVNIVYESMDKVFPKSL